MLHKLIILIRKCDAKGKKYTSIKLQNNYRCNIAAFLWEQRNAAQRNSRPELHSLINCKAQPERVNSLTLKQHPFCYCFANIDCSLRKGRINLSLPYSRKKFYKNFLSEKFSNAGFSFFGSISFFFHRKKKKEMLKNKLTNYSPDAYRVRISVWK